MIEIEPRIRPVTPLADADLDPAGLLAALPYAIVVLDSDDVIQFVNGEAEQMFAQGASQLVGASTKNLLPHYSALLSLVTQVRTSGTNVSEYDARVMLPRGKICNMTVQAAIFGKDDALVVLSIYQRSIATKFDRQIEQRNAVRSVTALSAMFAHEVKNPLSGIRGAAQLLQQTADDDDQKLTRLICEETDRICALVERELHQSLTLDATDRGRTETLSKSVERHLNHYFTAHGGDLPPAGPYSRILREVERPLISRVLSATRGNQIKAAEVLGVNRNTLRKKIRDLDIEVVRGLK